MWGPLGDPVVVVVPVPEPVPVRYTVTLVQCITWLVMQLTKKRPCACAEHVRNSSLSSRTTVIGRHGRLCARGGGV